MISIHRNFPLAPCVVLATTLGAPSPTSAQMNGRSMQSMRPLGMMGMPSMGRVGLMMGGMPNFGPTMNGMGGVSGRGQGTTMAQGGVPATSGSGGYGSGAARMTSQPYSYSPDAGYETANRESTRAPRAPGRDQLAALRGPGGGLSWPVALRYLTRDGAWKETRERIDSSIGVLLASKADASGAARVLSDLQEDVGKMRRHFDRQGDDTPVTRQQEAEARRFLNEVRDALLQFPESASSLKAR